MRSTVKGAGRGLLCSCALGLLLSSTPSAASATTPPLGSLLLAGRFQVETTWRTPDGTTGRGTGIVLTSETGYFWFFSPTNVEVVVKVLDACNGPSGRFWVFAGGLTDVFVELAVTDTETGESKTYHNPQGEPFKPIQDTGAFATCGTPRCGQGTFSEIAATPRADWELESLALFMGDRIAAPQALYDRVVADVAALRANGPGGGLNYVPPYETQSLIVTAQPSTALQMVSGTYTAWDCLNEWYGVVEVEPLPSQSVLLRFRGVLDMERLASDYRALPGVTHVSTNGYVFGLPPPGTGSLCGWAEGSIHYYFSRLTTPARYFTSEPGQAPVARGPVSADAAVQALAARCYEEHTALP